MATMDQLSVPITRETREMLDRHSKRTGINRAQLIEEAIRSYLIAHEGLRGDPVVSSTVQLSATSSKQIIRELKGRSPNAALKKLMRGGG